MTSAKKLNLVIASFLPLAIAVIAFFILPDLIINHIGQELGFGPKFLIFVLPFAILLWSFFWLFLDARRPEAAYYNVLVVNYLWLAILMWQIIYTIYRNDLIPNLVMAIAGILLLVAAFFMKNLHYSRLLDLVGFVIIIMSMFIF